MNEIQKIESNLLTFTSEQLTEYIFKVEEELLKIPQLAIPVKHHHSHDAYAREIRIPAGTILTGKVHKFSNLNILSEGEMLLVSIDGIKRVKAPYTVVSSAGVKRLALAVTDCTWTTIHGTTEKDVDRIEQHYTTNNMEELCHTLLQG